MSTSFPSKLVKTNSLYKSLLFSHIPHCPLPVERLPDDWKCTLCIPVEPIREKIDDFPENALLVSKGYSIINLFRLVQK
jgi:hypothetical protein